jgi:hypothetical protein
MGNAADVALIKGQLEGFGEDLSGPCGAFKITRRVAEHLANERAGLLVKRQGNNCEGFATDIICYPDGHIYDILIDGGGSNGPAWQDKGFVDPALYQPVTAPPSPEPVPEPQPPASQDEVLTRLTEIRDILQKMLDILS